MSFPPATEMVQFAGFASHDYGFIMMIPPKRWVAPFGDPRIHGRSPLPSAFRSVPRPSSPLGAKASTRCPSLELAHAQPQARAAARGRGQRADDAEAETPTSRRPVSCRCILQPRPTVLSGAKHESSLPPGRRAPAYLHTHAQARTRRPEPRAGMARACFTVTTRFTMSEIRGRRAEVGSPRSDPDRRPNSQIPRSEAASAAALARSPRMVGLGRFERPTSRLSGVRSNQLSYRPAQRQRPDDETDPAHARRCRLPLAVV